MIKLWFISDYENENKIREVMFDNDIEYEKLTKIINYLKNIT